MAERGKVWLGTLNNPEGIPQQILEAMLQKGVQHVIGQLEVGEEEKTPHIQLCVTLEQAQRLSFLKKLEQRTHWELAKCPQAARKYCSKEATRVAGPWEYGEAPRDR